LLWLSPRPASDDIGKFYANYLTHQVKGDHAAARRLYDKFKLALWARALNKPTLSPSFLWRHLAWISSLDPFIREMGQTGTMCLGGIKPGKLLDVGCGNGSFLAMMRSAGWDVSGIEPDPKAARLASEGLGIPVRVEQFRVGTFEAGSFDAVTLQHVIEHSHDPIGMMAECRRILKPGGHLAIVTPNLPSAGHKWFKADWRGLEPPRHLHLFSPKALAAGAEMAGIETKLVRTSARAASFIWLDSRQISRRRVGASERQSSLIGGLAFLAWERAVKAFRPGMGEELVLVGTPAV
jgi:2-polyprenyl-3-methyl-5-hydroxy-6-metoxy-1,4-benzoquinol methylase